MGNEGGNWAGQGRDWLNWAVMGEGVEGSERAGSLMVMLAKS